jgi:hypothetical protein
MKIVSALFRLALLAMAISVGGSFAQVPNGGFEDWTDCAPADWSINSVCGVFTPVTKTSDAHSGAVAARGEVIQFFSQAMQPIVQSGVDAEGVPMSQRYQNVGCFYRFAPVGGDRFGLNVAFFKGETVVAQGAKVFPATTGTAWAQGVVDMVYATADVPDRLIIQAMIFGPVTGSDYHVGSVMYLDDLSFDATGGGGTTPDARLAISISGNQVTVSWPAEVSGYRLQQSASLDAPNWSDVAGLAAADRSYKFTPSSAAYFRLVK